MRQSEPMRVAPRSWTKGSRTVSGPTSTSASMRQVSGRKMVTPAAMRRARGGETEGGVEVHHLGDGVGAEDLVDALGLDGDDALAVFDQQGGDVGEVELAVGRCWWRAGRVC